jgi:DNA repair protein RecO (recombination protein O)
MGLYRDQGVVLRTYRLGESDRIVVILTQGHGKVRAVAKGVRKTKSRFGARVEPMSHAALLFYEGRELDVITQAEALDRLTRAHALLEAADQMVPERQANPRLYQMLVGALRALSAHDAPLLVPAFFLKVLAMEGFHPVLDACAGCESTNELVGFDLLHGGALCAGCARAAAAPALSPEALGLIRRVLNGDLAGALNEPEGRSTAEISRLATRAMEHHLERRLRSVTVLDR